MAEPRQRSRRHRGEGSIRYRPKDDRWEASVPLGNGKRRTHNERTEQGARRWLHGALRTLDAGNALPDERLSVAAYLASWLDRIEPERERGTMTRHRDCVRLHIVPALGHIKLAKLTPLQVQTFYTMLLETKRLAPATVTRVHAVLHKALHDAERLDITSRNVCDRVRAPRAKKRAATIYTPEQARAFLASVVTDRLFALYLLDVSTGLRRGELLGLQWQDVELSNPANPGERPGGLLHVRRNLQLDRASNELYLKIPKSEAGKREMKLTPQVVEALRAHRARQNAERLQVGAPWQGASGEAGFIFCDEIGRPLHPERVYRRFIAAGKRAGLPRIRLHDLRHTFTTFMRSAGIPAEVLKELLGHEDIRTTLGVYGHVLPSMQDEAVAAIAKILAG